MKECCDKFSPTFKYHLNISYIYILVCMGEMQSICHHVHEESGKLQKHCRQIATADSGHDLLNAKKS